ncbi:MAG: hypothetical protein WC284_19085 [Candidimonas sp.]
MKINQLLNEKCDVITESIKNHDPEMLLTENIFRLGSHSYFEFFKKIRDLYNSGQIILTEENVSLITNTDIGL